MLLPLDELVIHSPSGLKGYVHRYWKNEDSYELLIMVPASSIELPIVEEPTEEGYYKLTPKKGDFFVAFKIGPGWFKTGSHIEYEWGEFPQIVKAERID